MRPPAGAQKLVRGGNLEIDLRCDFEAEVDIFSSEETNQHSLDFLIVRFRNSSTLTSGGGQGLQNPNLTTSPEPFSKAENAATMAQFAASMMRKMRQINSQSVLHAEKPKLFLLRIGNEQEQLLPTHNCPNKHKAKQVQSQHQLD